MKFKSIIIIMNIFGQIENSAEAQRIKAQQERDFRPEPVRYIDDEYAKRFIRLVATLPTVLRQAGVSPVNIEFPSPDRMYRFKESLYSSKPPAIPMNIVARGWLLNEHKTIDNRDSYAYSVTSVDSYLTTESRFASLHGSYGSSIQNGSYIYKEGEAMSTPIVDDKFFSLRSQMVLKLISSNNLEQKILDRGV